MASNGPSRILVIDDDDSITSFIAASLTIDGHQPIITSSVEDALHGFEAMNYAMVITDIFMDGMGGIEGIAEIRKRRPDIKIIAMSSGYAGMSTDNALLAAKKIGADATLAKPFTPEEISLLVGEMLD